MSKMPLRKAGDSTSPWGVWIDRAASCWFSVLLLRLKVLFMNVRANEPRRSPLAFSAFELVLAALGRRKKLKLGRRAELSEGEAGFSGLIEAVAIGGSARLSKPCVAVLVDAVVSEVSSASKSMRLLRGRWRLFRGRVASSRANARLLRPSAASTSVEADAHGCIEFRRPRVPLGEVWASLPRLSRPKLAKRDRDLDSGDDSGESLFPLPRRLPPGRLIREKNLDVEPEDGDEA